MKLDRIALGIGIFAILSVLLVSFCPAVQGPYSAVRGPITTFSGCPRSRPAADRHPNDSSEPHRDVCGLVTSCAVPKAALLCRTSFDEFDEQHYCPSLLTPCDHSEFQILICCGRTKGSVSNGVTSLLDCPQICLGHARLFCRRKLIVIAGSDGNLLATDQRRRDLRRYLAREPVILILLSGLAVVSFLVVAGLSHIYHAQQESLGNRWFARGVRDLKERRYDRAVTEFRTALLYSRDNYAYQLNLAEALMGMKRTDEAAAYFVNLWERQPENGLVNLELARISAQKGRSDQALRYYHNAIYATWPDDQEMQRRDTRVELIEYLLKMNTKAQAQSELIALAANLDDDPSQHDRVADLFLRAQDYEHALAQYRLSLKTDRRNSASLAGAGLAAFELGRYAQAQHYLQAAVTADPHNEESAERLKTTELVLQMDPFRRRISAAVRDRIVIEAFATAGRRLTSCATPAGSHAPDPQGSLAESWVNMKPRISEAGIRRDPDLVESAMDLVFRIERQTSTTCGAPGGTDRALLLIAQLHEGA